MATDSARILAKHRWYFVLRIFFIFHMVYSWIRSWLRLVLLHMLLTKEIGVGQSSED